MQLCVASFLRGNRAVKRKSYRRIDLERWRHVLLSTSKDRCILRTLIQGEGQGLTKSVGVGNIRTLIRELTAAGQWPRCWRFSCLIVILKLLLVTQIPRWSSKTLAMACWVRSCRPTKGFVPSAESSYVTFVYTVFKKNRSPKV